MCAYVHRNKCLCVNICICIVFLKNQIHYTDYHFFLLLFFMTFISQDHDGQAVLVLTVELGNDLSP
jgi:hypothetical protein